MGADVSKADAQKNCHATTRTKGKWKDVKQAMAAFWFCMQTLQTTAPFRRGNAPRLDPSSQTAMYAQNYSWLNTETFSNPVRLVDIADAEPRSNLRTLLQWKPRGNWATSWRGGQFNQPCQRQQLSQAKHVHHWDRPHTHLHPPESHHLEHPITCTTSNHLQFTTNKFESLTSPLLL